jgi:hypothetical protein
VAVMGEAVRIRVRENWGDRQNVTFGLKGYSRRVSG